MSMKILFSLRGLITSVGLGLIVLNKFGFLPGIITEKIAYGTLGIGCLLWLLSWFFAKWK